MGRPNWVDEPSKQRHKTSAPMAANTALVAGPASDTSTP